MKKLNIVKRLSAVFIVTLLVMLSTTAFLLNYAFQESVAERKAGLAAIDATAISIISSFHQKEEAGAMTREQAQEAAKAAIASMRYGSSGYLWINDMKPLMIMHPIKPDLNGTDLTDSVDTKGNHIFVEAVRVVKAKGQGFVDYYWPKPGAEKPVLKYSYVTGFEPWGWVVGTGVYGDDLDALFWANVRVVGGLTGSASVILAIAAWWIVGSVVRPLKKLKITMDEIAAGNGHAEVSGTERSDEIGEMANALLILRDSVNEREHLHQQNLKQQQDAEAARARNEETLRAGAEKQALAIDELGRALEKLATGDLTADAGDMGEDYAKLRTDFNIAVTALHDAIAAVAGSGTVVDTNAIAIHQATGELAQRTERQAAALEEAAAALEQITTMVGTASLRASEAQEVVYETRENAETSGQTMRAAIDAMGRIEDSSRQINQIISVIDEIAFQTNLLALNAGVEAARAGDAGRGFAVVAQEVRELAQRSASAAREIKDLINTSATEVKSGVSLVRAAGEALLNIGAMVNRVNDHVETIATAAREQASGLSEINSTVNHMDQMTQQNAAMVSDTTEASHALASESAQLRSLLKRFRLRTAPGDSRRAA